MGRRDHTTGDERRRSPRVWRQFASRAEPDLPRNPRHHVEDDGVTSDLDSVQGDPIRAHKEYVGLRIDLRANLCGAVVRVQVDVGIGDAVRPAEITLPTLLAIP